MPSLNLNSVWFDEESNEWFERKPRQKRPQRVYKPKRSAVDIAASLAADRTGEDEFDFSYHASRHERQWIVDSLGNFYDSHWLTDVTRLIKSGKEASVYQCATHPETFPGGKPYLAAKVYRPRRFRNLKNDHLYREGRSDLDADGNLINDDGMLHAIRKRTEYGRQLLHASWIEYEFQTMTNLLSAGADVPFPHTRGDNAILMAYIGDADMAAPTLNSVNLEPGEARRLFDRVVHNIDLMLANRTVHGDLSAYNLLYWEGEITLIDFPQAIDPLINRNALPIFERDVRRIWEYFVSQKGADGDPRQLARALWKKHRYPMKPDVHPGLLDEDNRDDREYWARLNAADEF